MEADIFVSAASLYQRSPLLSDDLMTGVGIETAGAEKEAKILALQFLRYSFLSSKQNSEQHSGDIAKSH